MNDPVQIVHGDIDHPPVTVERAAFNETWEGLGWELYVPVVDPAPEWIEVTAEDVAATSIHLSSDDDVDPDDLTDAELDALTDPVTPSDTDPHTPDQGEED